jgi:uncharacterized pyridoxamine 5'-phosphate oxidase family protein
VSDSPKTTLESASTHTQPPHRPGRSANAKAQERGSVMLKLFPLLKIVFPKNTNSVLPVFVFRDKE